MRRYETFFIADPDISEEERGQLFEKTKDLISQQEGFLVMFDDWGVKKLAYEIKKKNRGHYIRLDYSGNGALVAEMERSFRIDDRVMKFMTILLEESANLDDLKEEQARTSEEKTAQENVVEEKPADSAAVEAETEEGEETTTESNENKEE
ncbi:MAG: 30S ribosomal protein S6 [Deltaproteobacteria bacterium]|nr:30S ribosomal protein S6 [Deltaproteobacteria bacterium]MBW2010655.1 30S ribosomal protein S6 [Deltaproteobacteria bacterium]